MHYIGLVFGEVSNIYPYDCSEGSDQYILYTKEEAINTFQTLRANARKTWKETIINKPFEKERCLQLLKDNPPLNKRRAWAEVRKAYEEQIDEDGNVWVDYNPEGKWDWYEIGGRWKNYLILNRKHSTSTTHAVASTIKGVNWSKTFSKNYLPYCYITEEGEWIEEIKDSNDIMKYIKSCDPETIVTVIDFHI